jgi:hypothetical protein
VIFGEFEVHKMGVRIKVTLNEIFGFVKLMLSYFKMLGYVTMDGRYEYLNLE